MRPWFFVVLLALFAAGCEPKARQDIARDGEKAIEHASRAAVSAWTSLAAKVKEISPESTDDAIAQARAAALDLQKKAQAIPNPTPEVKAQLEAAQASLAKIDAAEQLKKLQYQALVLGESTREHYAKLQQQIAEARKRYEESAAAVEKLRPSATEGR